MQVVTESWAAYARGDYEASLGAYAENTVWEELVAAGDRVISVVWSGGRGRTSGTEVSKTHAGVWTFHDRKVVQVQWFGTRDDALEAAGLSE